MIEWEKEEQVWTAKYLVNSDKNRVNVVLRVFYSYGRGSFSLAGPAVVGPATDNSGSCFFTSSKTAACLQFEE